MIASKYLAVVCFVSMLALTACISERQDGTPTATVKLTNPSNAMRWNITRDKGGHGQKSIELKLDKLDDKYVIYFVTKKEFDLVLFCDEPPLKRCAKGLGEFYTTEFYHGDDGELQFDPIIPFPLDPQLNSIELAVVGISDAEVSAESRFAIILEK